MVALSWLGGFFVDFMHSKRECSVSEKGARSARQPLRGRQTLCECALFFFLFMRVRSTWFAFSPPALFPFSSSLVLPLLATCPCPSPVYRQADRAAPPSARYSPVRLVELLEARARVGDQRRLDVAVSVAVRLVPVERPLDAILPGHLRSGSDLLFVRGAGCGVENEGWGASARRGHLLAPAQLDESVAVDVVAEVVEAAVLRARQGGGEGVD